MARKKYTEFEKEIMIKSARNLKEILNRKGVSQKSLADGIGLSTSVISDYVNAKTLITPGSLERIAAFLKVDTTEIYSAFNNEKNSNARSLESDTFDIEKMAEGVLEFRGRVLTEEEKEKYLMMTRALFE